VLNYLLLKKVLREEVLVLYLELSATFVPQRLDEKPRRKVTIS